MLLAILLIPALIAMAMLNTMSASRVLVKLYVPCLMLVPIYMTKALGGFLISDTTAVITLLCIVGLVRWHSSLKFGLVDACVLLFAFSVFYSDARHRPLNVGIYVLCQNLTMCTFPYFAGRTLIEQTGSRRDFAKTLVFCLAVIGLLSLYEYRMESNLFDMMVRKLTGEPSGWGLQTRWGFARIAGPYGDSILAAMMFSAGLMLQLWLTGTKTWEGSRALRFFRVTRRSKAITFGVCIGLLLTQSRGPWIGCAFGLIIASVGFAKDRRRAAVIAVVGLVIAISVTSVFLNNYTSQTAFSAGGGGDENQQNAAYRRNLIPLYTPVIIEGGFWGLGSPTVVNNQGGVGYLDTQASIDNEFLRVAVAQGYFGAGLFVLILLASIYRAARLCATFKNRSDIMLAYCLLGALLALSFTLTTVALLNPVTELLFLLLGWTQSLQATRSEQDDLVPAPASQFGFRRVFA